MPAIVTRTGMMFVHSIREIFVCSLRKTFGHLSHRSKKTVINGVVNQEHYIGNNAFVSRDATITLLHMSDNGAALTALRRKITLFVKERRLLKTKSLPYVI